jgi:hypothetical protein
LEESTNITNLLNLLARFENNVRLTIKEGFVFYKSLTASSPTEAISDTYAFPEIQTEIIASNVWDGWSN